MICIPGRLLLWICATEFQPDDDKQKLLRRCFYDSVSRFTLPAFVALLLTRWRVGCTAREWGSHHFREGCSPMVLKEFICHAECQEQVRPLGTIDFRADSSPSPPPSPLQPPQAELDGCVTQSRDEVKVWVRSNEDVQLRSSRGFDKALPMEGSIPGDAGGP